MRSNYACLVFRREAHGPEADLEFMRDVQRVRSLLRELRMEDVSLNDMWSAYSKGHFDYTMEVKGVDGLAEGLPVRDPDPGD